MSSNDSIEGIRLINGPNGRIFDLRYQNPAKPKQRNKLFNQEVAFTKLLFEKPKIVLKRCDATPADTNKPERKVEQESEKEVMNLI